MKDVDLAWAAGFIDGEGHLSIRVMNRIRTNYYATIEVAGCDLRPLNKLRSLFGGGIYAKAKWPENRNWKQAYRWCISSGGASACIRLIRPYLDCKDIQADIILEFTEGVWLTPGRRPPMSEEEHSRRRALVARMKATNMRGRMVTPDT